MWYKCMYDFSAVHWQHMCGEARWSCGLQRGLQKCHPLAIECCPGGSWSCGQAGLLCPAFTCWYCLGELLIVGFLFSFSFSSSSPLPSLLNSCSVWTAEPLENDKASFLPAFVALLIISFLIVYSFEVPLQTESKYVCLQEQFVSVWLSKTSRYCSRYWVLQLGGPG